MVEQLTLNQLVLGSSPSRGTISSQIYKISALFNQGAFCFRDPFHLPAFNFTPNNTDPSSDSFAKPNPKPTPQRRLTHPPDHTLQRVANSDRIVRHRHVQCLVC